MGSLAARSPVFFDTLTDAETEKKQGDKCKTRSVQFASWAVSQEAAARRLHQRDNQSTKKENDHETVIRMKDDWRTIFPPENK